MATQDKEYCNCTLPIKVKYGAKEAFKVPRCSFCMMEVDPASKAVDKVILPIGRFNSEPTRNEKLLGDKINEIIELLKANGDMQ